MKNKIIDFCKAQPVLLIAFFVALLTMFMIPPDNAYINYCNKTVLIQLFSLMTAVAGLRSVGIFEKMTEFSAWEGWKCSSIRVIIRGDLFLFVHVGNE